MSCNFLFESLICSIVDLISSIILSRLTVIYSIYSNYFLNFLFYCISSSLTYYWNFKSSKIYLFLWFFFSTTFSKIYSSSSFNFLVQKKHFCLLLLYFNNETCKVLMASNYYNYSFIFW